MSLYGIVEEYAALGIHRTGTSVDRATVDWMAEQLADAGLTVEREPYDFEQWTAESMLTADGDAVDHLPVFHEFVGSIDTTDIHVEVIDPLFGGFPSVLGPAIATARDVGAGALVVATQHDEGALVAINRHPEHGSRVPTALVAGSEAERLTNASSVRLVMDSTLTPSWSTNLFATNDLDGPVLMLTTPLTGWFTCAGERGTGIAVTIDLARRLTQAGTPVQVLATTGHELENLGARRWLDRNVVDAVATMHIGASVGVPDALRAAMTNVEADDASDLVDAVGRAGIALRTDADNWLGEGQLHAATGVPLLSFSGAGIDFHTPNDVPDRVTSPEFMNDVADALFDAAVALASLSNPA